MKKASFVLAIVATLFLSACSGAGDINGTYEFYDPTSYYETERIIVRIEDDVAYVSGVTGVFHVEHEKGNTYKLIHNDGIYGMYDLKLRFTKKSVSLYYGDEFLLKTDR